MEQFVPTPGAVALMSLIGVTAVGVMLALVASFAIHTVSRHHIIGDEDHE